MKHTFDRLRLNSVCRSFANAEGAHVAALQGLDLAIERGEFIALLGPSGCGKSTALNCIAGLQPLTGGEIWLDDKRISVSLNGPMYRISVCPRVFRLSIAVFAARVKSEETQSKR